MELLELTVRLVEPMESPLAIPVESGTMGVGASPGLVNDLSSSRACTEPTDSTKITTGRLLELTSLNSVAPAVDSDASSALDMLSKKDRFVGPEASVAIVVKSYPEATPRI